MMAGANIVTVIVRCLTGYSDRLNPVDHPVLSCAGMTFPFFLLVNLAFLCFWIIFKFRMIWIPVLGYFLAYVPISIYMPLNMQSSEVPEDAVKFISYNVCCYGGNYKYEQGFEKVCEYLFEENPDIVCLQEDVDTWRRYCFKYYEKKFAYNDTIQFGGKPSPTGLVSIPVSPSCGENGSRILQKVTAVRHGTCRWARTRSWLSTTISRSPISPLRTVRPIRRLSKVT